MNQRQTNKKRKNKKLKHHIWTLIFLAGSIFCLYKGLSIVFTKYEIKQNIEETKAKTKKLEKKKKELEKTKKNLSDPDYIEYIARGKYLVTKEGEQVFKFPSSSDKTNSD